MSNPHLADLVVPTISQATRFEVLSRDGWTCQYCGRRAPAVTLNVERARPIIDGGSLAQVNLFACCTDCARGRRISLARGLTQAASAPPGRTATAPLHGHGEDWAALQAEFIHDALERLCEDLAQRTGLGVTDPMRRVFASIEAQCGIDTLWSVYQTNIDAALGALPQSPMNERIDLTMGLVARVSARRARDREYPHERRLYLIRGVLRARLVYLSETDVMEGMQDALRIGVPVDLIERLARECADWGVFWAGLFAMMRGRGGSPSAG